MIIRKILVILVVCLGVCSCSFTPVHKGKSSSSSSKKDIKKIIYGNGSTFTVTQTGNTSYNGYITINGKKFCFNKSDNKSPIISRNIEVSKFSGIDINLSANINIFQGVSSKVEVVGREDIVKKINALVQKGICKIEFEKNSCYSYENLDINITVPNLTSLKSEGCGDILVNDFENQKSLNIDLSGSSKLKLNKFGGVKKMYVSLTNSSRMKAMQNVESLELINLKISGASKFYGFKINSDNCKIDLSSVSLGEISVRNSLMVMLSGASKIKYKGHPDIIKDFGSTCSFIDAN